MNASTGSWRQSGLCHHHSENEIADALSVENSVRTKHIFVERLAIKKLHIDDPRVTINLPEETNTDVKVPNEVVYDFLSWNLIILNIDFGSKFDDWKGDRSFKFPLPWKQSENLIDVSTQCIQPLYIIHTGKKQPVLKSHYNSVTASAYLCDDNSVILTLRLNVKSHDGPGTLKARIALTFYWQSSSDE